MVQNVQKQFQEFMARKGLRSTHQREIILQEFLKSRSHLSTEDLYLRLRRKHPNIGYATVHRTLKIFAECGIAEERNFGDGQTRFEVTGRNEHHDHLICTACKTIIEFEDPRIEALQEQVAQDHRFTITHHRLELYGLCENCAGEKAENKE